MDWHSVIDRIDDIYSEHLRIHWELYAFWEESVLFTWRWWFKLSMLFVPWALWFALRKKESSGRLMTAGLFVMALALFLDSVGITLGLWFYPTVIVPLLPEALSFNLSVLPVVTMLSIQFFPRMKPLYKAVPYAAAGAFVFEPLMVWMGLYEPIHWKHIYTFPVLIGIYLIADRITRGRSYAPVGEGPKATRRSP